MIGPHTVIAVPALLVLSLWCAWTDLAQRRIANAAVAALAALYPLALATGALPGPLWLGPTVAAAIFALGLACFALGAVGGGDVKLAATLGLWAGSSDPAGFFLITAAVGACLSLLILATRRTAVAHIFAGPLMAGPQTGGRAATRESVPYGVALAAGGLWIAYGLIAA